MTQRNNGTGIGPKRSAGVLMHISSLPGPFGIGDLGPGAREFADFLHRTHQSYWQLLPLNPTERSTGHSPYSSISAFAGNVLFISPELLRRDGLLDRADLKPYVVQSTDRVDYAHAEESKRALLEKAFTRFKLGKNIRSRNAFNRFCAGEKKWLDNFALYVGLRKQFNQAWHQWPDAFRDRDPAQLRAFAREHVREIEKIKWEQFVFFNQWQELAAYCRELGIKLFGDLPFYVSHDSADVWAARELFAVDSKGKMKEVAGVPPDYFNENGQLWGMPVFQWSKLREKKYSWWVDRIRANISLFDVIRLDHFRAFAGYWAVPGSESTARNGKWKKGPGSDFFDTLQRKLGVLPFIAEDLGDIDNAVHDLRISNEFPGMKVLQFAFGGNFPESEYLPHLYEENFVVYTGTHDNNTVRGWYDKDAGTTEKKNLSRYLDERTVGRKIHTLLIRMAYASIARTAIVPMQDILGLDHRSRMNAPATIKGNWLWRMKPEMITAETERWLADLTEVFGRKA